MKKYYSSGFFNITVTAMISFISQNEYKLSQEYQELRQQISKSDRTMSQNIKGIYLLNFFLFQYFYGPAARHCVFPMSIPHLISTQVPLQ